MAKGERKQRRRKPDLQTDPGASPAAGGEAAAGESTAAADELAPPPGGGETPPGNGSESAEEARGWPDGTPPRQIALAEILVNPDLVGRNDYPSAPSTSAKAPASPPAPEQVAPKEPQRWSQQDEPVQAPPPSAPTHFETEIPASPQTYSRDDLGLAPPDERQHWTREPMLVGLLLAALLVLIFDTYFTLRLNGLSDRLAAMTSGVAATAVGERPWVGVDSIKTAAFASGGQPVTTVHIINSGHEPAYDLRSNTAGSLRSAATAGPSVPAQKGQLAVTALLLPNVGGNLTFFANTRALTAEEAANVRSGQYVLWLTGRLDYRDSHGHPHLTTFRYRYNPALNSFMATPEGNSAN